MELPVENIEPNVRTSGRATSAPPAASCRAEPGPVCSSSASPPEAATITTTGSFPSAVLRRSTIVGTRRPPSLG